MMNFFSTAPNALGMESQLEEMRNQRWMTRNQEKIFSLVVRKYLMKYFSTSLNAPGMESQLEEMRYMRLMTHNQRQTIKEGFFV